MMSKLSLRGKSSSAKLTSWVEPSFGDLLGGSSGAKSFTLKKGARLGESRSIAWPSSQEARGKRPRKRGPESQGSETLLHSESDVTQAEQDEPWVDIHAPQSQADLAVHKKKVEEVEGWLRIQLERKPVHKGGAILLLTGPSGCGKTATVRVLAHEHGCRIQEWSNPSGTSEYRTDESYKETFDPDSRFNSFHGSSQTGAFQEFLLRANKYRHLLMSGESQTSDRRIILIEDFPNQFYRQPGCLHDLLRRFVRTGKCPLVFIVSDSLSGDRGSRLLFPKDVQEELGISNISFNPVAPTSMIKVLSRIVAIEAGKRAGRISVPDKSSLELLSSGSAGDIRSAINSLQFSSLTGRSVEKGLTLCKKGKTLSSSLSSVKGSVKARRKSTSSRAPDSREDGQAIGGKDTSLFLFRALGRILYCKRESYEGSEAPKLPAHLSEHQRDKLLVDPELVVERSHMSGELFNLYLHQNYLDFFSNVEDVTRASEYLSDADFLTADWTSRTTMAEYGSSVATRGLLHSNSARAQATSQSNVGFRPFHKPHWLQIGKTYRENCWTAQSLFISFCLPPVSIQTELLPYLAKLSNPMRNQAQIAFIQDVGHLSLRRLPGRLKLEALGDKDPGVLDLESEDDEVKPSTVNVDAPGSLGESGELEEPSGDFALQCSNPEAGGDLPASQPRPSTSEALVEEEDLLIEEYDSD